MFKDIEAFSGYSINDTEQSRHFYADVLGMEVTDVQGMEEYGLLELHIKNGHSVLLYPKSDHEPATFTVLSFPVSSIDDTIEALASKGVSMIHYNNSEIIQDEKGVSRGISEGKGPDIAWFKDPSGNTLAVLQQS